MSGRGRLGALLLLRYISSLSATVFSLWTMLLKYNNVGKVTVYNFQIPVSDITVDPGWREAMPGDVKELIDSILGVERVHPVAHPLIMDQANTLIVGLHRLEAMKLLGWRSIECTISNLDGLQCQNRKQKAIGINGEP